MGGRGAVGSKLVIVARHGKVEELPFYGPAKRGGLSPIFKKYHRILSWFTTACVFVSVQHEETEMSETPTTTTIITTKQEKSVLAAFLLTFLFGPLGLLYATIGGGIAMIIIAIIIGAVTLGFGALITWPIAMIWGVLAALASKNQPTPTK